MFSSIRRHMCYANVVATLALMFAMSGGALAASHYLLTSTRQISPKVLKALEGKPGPVGPAGPAGATGNAGAQGPAGTQGAKGETGAQGPLGETGPQGAKGTTGASGPAGPAGSPWTAGGTLPSGKTETGVWQVSGPETEIGFPVNLPLASFPIPLSASTGLPTWQAVGVREGAGEPKEHLPAGCKGNWEHPEAEPGYLCVFEMFSENVSLKQGDLSDSGDIAILERSEQAYNAAGVWAVTAK